MAKKQINLDMQALTGYPLPYIKLKFWNGLGYAGTDLTTNEFMDLAYWGTLQCIKIRLGLKH